MTQAKHKLEIRSLHDAQAVCSCGEWQFTGTGKRTAVEIRAEFLKHAPKMQTPKEYAQSLGALCPVCRSYDIQGHDVDVDAGTVYQNCTCNECRSTWTDVYYLQGYSNLQDQEDNDIQPEPEPLEAAPKVSALMASYVHQARAAIENGDTEAAGDLLDEIVNGIDDETYAAGVAMAKPKA